MPPKADLMSGIPANITLKWPPGFLPTCEACGKQMHSPNKLVPCEELVCDQCCTVVKQTAVCPLCNGDVDRTEKVQDAIKYHAAQATAACKDCAWQGSYNEAKHHVCGVAAAGFSREQSDTDGLGAYGGSIGDSGVTSPNTTGPGAEMVYDNDGLIPATEEPYVTYLYWDYDNVQPPGGEGNFVKFYMAMVRALEQLRMKEDGKRVIYSRHFVDAKCFVRGSGTSDNLELQAQKVRVEVHVAGQKKEATDRLIDREVKSTLKDFKKMFGEDGEIPHHVVIVSSDTDFIECVSECEEAGVSTTVVYTAKAGSEHGEVLQYHASATLTVDSFLPPELAALAQAKTASAAGKNTKSAAVGGKGAASKNVASTAAASEATTAADEKPAHVPQRVVATSKGANSATVDKTYPVDGSYVLESLLIRNRALDYLDTHQYRQGKKCTNPREHDTQDCSFIHYRRNPNRKR